jgi:hypothetical protein
MAAAAALVCGTCAGPVAPDLVITNARVFTNDTARPWADALAIKGQHVVAVGTASGILGTKAASTRVIDAGGRVVVPGFNDARVELPLQPPTSADLSALDRVALSLGVTSLQVVAGGPMRVLVDAARQAQRQARWRVLRSPEDGERPRDEAPFLPPDAGVRLAATGVSWVYGDAHAVRGSLEPSRLPTVVGWAYGAEDPLVMAGEGERWLAALSGQGIAEVWRRKRPRLDLLIPLVEEDVAAVRRLGVVVTWLPATAVTRGKSRAEPAPRPGVSAGVLLDRGIVLALGSAAGTPRLMATVAATVTANPQASGRPLTREEAVHAATWGSAYAEKTEHHKGRLSPGTLADLAILSEDVFSAPIERLPAVTSVLTLVGGTIVYDPGILPRP